MNPFHAGTIALSALALGSAGHAFAQVALLSSQSADIEQRLYEDELDHDIAGRRYVLGQSLAEDETARHAFSVERGRSYFGLAVCDDGCSDIDLVVRDAAGNVLDNDEAGAADLVLLFRAEATGRVEIEVIMKACEEDACEYGLGFHTLRGNGERIQGA